MVNFESLSLASIEKSDLENWLIKIDFYLDQIL